LAAADAEDGKRGGPKAQEAEQLRELKRRNRLLEQENEVLRRAAACHDNSPPLAEAGGGELPGKR
jgi:transposase-like protein